MRKMFLALVAMFAMAGLVLAATGSLVKVDGNNVTIKVGDKEETYDAKDAKIQKTVKGKAEDGTIADLEKAAKKGANVEFEHDGKKLKSITVKGGKKK